MVKDCIKNSYTSSNLIYHFSKTEDLNKNMINTQSVNNIPQQNPSQFQNKPQNPPINRGGDFNIINNLLIITVIFSALGSLLVLFTTFGEAVVYEDWNKYYYYIELDFTIAGFIVLIVGLLLLICTFITIMALIDKKYLNNVMVNIVIIISLVVVLIAIIGTIIGVALTDDYWVDFGFFGAVIGGLITLILYLTLKKNYLKS
jgi:hypothetical protein